MNEMSEYTAHRFTHTKLQNRLKRIYTEFYLKDSEWWGNKILPARQRSSKTWKNISPK